jgi:hypothetical protein
MTGYLPSGLRMWKLRRQRRMSDRARDTRRLRVLVILKVREIHLA